MSVVPLNIDTARRVLEVVDEGLVRGVGKPVPGKMCVEAAICYTLGLPHGDDPGCVASAVRAFKVRLNDSSWSSPTARATGLRALAVAQLGSKGTINSAEFVRRLAEKTIRTIVPIALRAAAQRRPECAQEFEAAAIRCEQDGTARAARAARMIAAYAAAYAAADAADAAASAASSASYASYAAAAAASAADAADKRDAILALSASLALDVLREMNAPGVALWDEVTSTT